MPQRVSAELGPLAAPEACAGRRPPRAALRLSGAVGALALAAYTVAGALGAALALLPAALRGGPRGRGAPARQTSPETSDEPLTG